MNRATDFLYETLCTIMRKILLSILLFLIYSNLIAQKIDTTQIKSIRYEWNLNIKSNDSSLTQILKEFKSGIFKDDYSDFDNQKSKFGNYFLYDAKNKEGYLKAEVEHIALAVGNVFQRNFYDKDGYLESVFQKIWRNDTLKELSFKTKKTYDDRSRLKTLIERSKTYQYFYNENDAVERIEYYNDSTISKISDYRNGLLISEVFPQRKYRKEFTYVYDEKNRMIKKDDDDFFYYIYKYNDFGIEQIERIYKKKEMSVGLETFEYNDKGLLIVRKVFVKGKLINEYHYTYK